MCCLVLRSNFALLLTIQFALLFFFPPRFCHNFVRAIALEPLLTETPNWVCCLVQRWNFALLLTIQFASLFIIFFFATILSGPYLWNRYSQRLQIECAAWSCGLILHCCLPSNSLRYFFSATILSGVEFFIFGDRSSVAYRASENLSRFINLFVYLFITARKIIFLFFSVVSVILFYLFIYLFIYLFFIIIFFVCYHAYSWKAQPIRTKFPHKTFDWNISAMYENGHLKSHVTSVVKKRFLGGRRFFYLKKKFFYRFFFFFFFFYINCTQIILFS